MQKSIKVLALLLALLCFVTVFVACDGGETNQNDEETTAGKAQESTAEATETETEFFPEVEKQNYGAEFYLNIQAGGTNPKKFYWVEEGSKDAMSEAIYARQTSVYDHLGVEIIGVEAGTYDT